MYLNPITLTELHSALQTTSNSSAIGSDGINPVLIKNNFAIISSHLLYIFNLSFAQGVFPYLLKTAIITPIFKNGSHNDLGNYRPISILTNFSKLLEKFFYNRLLTFIAKYNILHTNQLSFRAKKSTSHALAHVLCSLIDKCNNNENIVLALLDLKKAFDLINHYLSIKKLACYGVRDLSLKWLSSYLSNHLQKTKVNGSFPNIKPISAGLSYLLMMYLN